MKNKLIILVLVLTFVFTVALGEEALPQLEKVNFSTENLSPIPSNPKDNFLPNENGFSHDGLFYHDDSLDIKVYHIRKYDTPIVVAFVQIASPYQLKTEQARPYPSKATMRIVEIGKRVNSVIAINADWFTYHNSGIVYRNGELLRNRPDDQYDGLAIDINGDLHIVRPMIESEFAKIATPILHSFAFGPALVMDNQVLEIVNRKVTYKQRMAIGQVAPLSYVLVATDGPDQKNSVGLSVPQLAELMHDLGAHTAYNLDGGQSTSMLMHKTKINGQAPKTMRAVGDIIYFTTAISNHNN
ncbi:MAG: phosphodiester glycosidase family protein [Christensenellaceae bacterium]|nr:phosphodiester glycosidase family protein [Christensenellaceae bacterium]